MKCLKCKKEISKNQISKYGLHAECFSDWFNVAYETDFNSIVTRNFIDKKKRMVLHHIYHYLKRGDKFDVKTLIKIIEKHTGRLSQIERFVQLCLFDALIGNHDRHGRNLALLEEKGRLSLSPFYNNPSYIGVEEEILLGAQLSPRGKIATSHTQEPSMQDYVKQFIDLGYHEICRNFYNSIDMVKISILIKESPVSDQRKKALMRLINERYKELENEIKI